jgi:CDP-4-dehydro-6-deoxyglucose reductase, E1
MHPLMHNNIIDDDLECLISFLQTKPRLTQAAKVDEFERQWSEWLGVKYSVFVNSGSSANLISLAVLKLLVGNGEVIVPPLTWVSDIASVIQNGFEPKFVDINLNTLSMDNTSIIDSINTNTKAVFMTHVQGFNGLTDELIETLDRKNIILIEDVCESHGATFNNKKLGSIGLMSNFSFYYAHHMSTIEGGMVCTNDEDIYQKLRMLRSHGLVRESNNESFKQKYLEENLDLNSEFIFAFPAYNVRNNEIGAVLGLNQLKRLDSNNSKRSENLRYFLDQLDKELFYTDFLLEGSSNYAFNIILNNKDFELRDRIEDSLQLHEIEFRRGSAGGGNQLRQPYLKDYVESDSWKNFPNTEHIHHFAWYVGNYPDLEKGKIDEICSVLNNVK